jgi:hypothetical protein
VTDFELARRHYVYFFDANSTPNVTNDTKSIKLKGLVGVSIKKKATHAIKRTYKQYHRQRCSIIVSNIIDVLKELI